MSERKIVIPGEIIAEGEEYLPGEWTEKSGDKVFALRYGLVEESNKLIKIIPLSGTYQPRKGNVVIGVVENILLNGWVIDIGTPENSFLPVSEVPKYVNKYSLNEVIDIGNLVVAKIFEINKRGIDLTIRARGLGKVEKGTVIRINSNRVPRVIGKEGSMINLIKEETNCKIVVGQNGLIWIEGDKIEDEILAKRAINFISEKPFISGLTDEVKKWLGEEKTK